MKLSELSKLAKDKTGSDDPEIRIVSHNGFDEIKDVLARTDYHDESFFGCEHEKGDFACVEFL